MENNSAENQSQEETLSFENLVNIDADQSKAGDIDNQYKDMNLEKKKQKIENFNNEKLDKDLSKLRVVDLRRILGQKPEWKGKSAEIKAMKKPEMIALLQGEIVNSSTPSLTRSAKKSKGAGVFNLLMLSAFGTEKAVQYFDVDLNGYKDDILKEKKTLLPICESIAEEYCNEIDTYVSPVSQLGGALTIMAMNRYATNLKAKGGEVGKSVKSK